MRIAYLHRQVEGLSQLVYITRSNSPYGEFSRKAFQVAHHRHTVAKVATEFAARNECCDNLLTLLDRFEFYEWKYQPPPKQASAHRAVGKVYDVE